MLVILLIYQEEGLKTTMKKPKIILLTLFCNIYRLSLFIFESFKYFKKTMSESASRTWAKWEMMDGE